MKTTLGLLVLTAVLFLSCQSRQQSEDSQKPSVPADTQWRMRMHELSEVVSQLIPLGFSPEAFNDPKNEKTIASLFDRLDGLAHNLEDQAQQPLIEDPTMRLIAQEFEEEIEVAERAFHGGQKEFSRFVLKDTLSYCIECHTQKPQGTNFMALDLGQQIDQLSLLARGEFFAATRQFDRALEVYKTILTEGRLPAADLERAIVQALTITIRYLRSPEQSTEVVNLVLKNSDLPYYLRRDAKAWQQAIAAWKKDWPKEKTLQGEDLLNQARTLLQEGRGRGEFPSDAKSAVENLRASALLHLYLSEDRTAPQQAEALLLLGQAYEGVGPANMGQLHNRFYESCIRRAPHSNTAAHCYKRFYENTMMGYSGSAGTALPKDVQQRLQTLKSLASPKAKSK